MKLIMILTTVCLTVIGCAKGGDSSSGSNTAQSVYGSYAAAFKTTSGDTLILYANFSPGQYETRTYGFPGSNMFKGTYIDYKATDTVVGDNHTLTLTYDTCPTYNGQTVPTAPTTTTVTPLNSDTIIIHSDMANADITFDQISDIDSYLNGLGMSIAVEDTSCATLP